MGQLAQEHMGQVETEWVGQNTPESTLYEGVRKHVDYYHQKRHQSIKMSPLERYEQSLIKKAA